ncbi:hypothetical protein L6164_006767 [Bauhinia variegata]|uniref:Uncharacterized protein n=1 Tax=Bauhinia variegata TaxID=167791 RepID=A0ACB9PUY0_BAUVA|nr:hypothetical protein L6164_006767 [Bauhinia variegata]
MENFRILTIMSMVIMIMYPLEVMGDPGPTLHKLGGSKGWNPNQDVNYTAWSAQEHFYVGDWLLFMFDKRYYNVLEVNKTSYENCNDRDFIKNITRGGRDVVQLTEAKTYYYISGGGYCYHGMKVLVSVQKHQEAAAPAPAPAENFGNPLSVYSGRKITLCSMVFAGFILWGIL